MKKAYDSVPRQALWVALRKLGVPELSVQLIRSFHSDTKAKIRSNGEALDAIDVQNGLRQGCCVAPVLFNLYTCLVVERWLVNVGGEVDVGIVAHYKYIYCLFRRYTRNALERLFTDRLFADDGALLASTRSGAKQAACMYKQVSKNFDLTVSIPKTKHMVTGRLTEDSDRDQYL